MQPSTRRKINRFLARAMLIVGLVFLLYVAFMYYRYFFTNWQKP